MKAYLFIFVLFSRIYIIMKQTQVDNNTKSKEGVSSKISFCKIRMIQVCYYQTLVSIYIIRTYSEFYLSFFHEVTPVQSPSFALHAKATTVQVPS